MEDSHGELCGLVVKSVKRVKEFLTTDTEVRVRFSALPDFFWKLVGLEQGPQRLVMIIEELFQGKSGSGLGNRN
jgi:hypothetical protein